jgi:hypothetical protein
MAQEVMKQLPNCIRKQLKALDWNEQLKNLFHLEQKQQGQRKHERNQSRGFNL